MLLEFEKVQRSIICQLVSFITENLDEKCLQPPIQYITTIDHSSLYLMVYLSIEKGILLRLRLPRTASSS